MQKGYIGALDQGTTSTRFVIFDSLGRIRAIAQKEHSQICPRAGWVEHDAEEIWRGAEEVISDALSKANASREHLDSIGITNQRETAVFWDRLTGKPAGNAIVWQDTRTADYVKEMLSGYSQEFFLDKTGLPLSTYFSALKILWFLENTPGARELAEDGTLLFGNIDTFLIWRLTGGCESGIHITDVTNASRTQLMDIATCAWDPELLRLFRIPESMLPRIRSSSEVYGVISRGKLRGTPIAGILGDQHAALVGQTCFRAGDMKNTYGTGCFALMNTGNRRIQSKHGMLTTVAHKFGEQPTRYALEGSVAIAGALVHWMRDNLGLIQSSGDIEALARTVPDNGGVYCVPAFSGLYAPHWRPDARGVVVGLTRFSNKGHLARAVLEATAFQTREVIEAIEEDVNTRVDTLRVDGGMVRNELLMQFQADILDRQVLRPQVTETTALGAAYAAGLATSFFRDVGELCSHSSADRTWAPEMTHDRREELFRSWKKAVARSLDWAE